MYRCRRRRGRRARSAGGGPGRRRWAGAAGAARAPARQTRRRRPARGSRGRCAEPVMVVPFGERSAGWIPGTRHMKTPPAHGRVRRRGTGRRTRAPPREPRRTNGAARVRQVLRLAALRRVVEVGSRLRVSAGFTPASPGTRTRVQLWWCWSIRWCSVVLGGARPPSHTGGPPGEPGQASGSGVLEAHRPVDQVRSPREHDGSTPPRAARATTGGRRRALGVGL